MDPDLDAHENAPGAFPAEEQQDTHAQADEVDPEQDPNARQCRFCLAYVAPSYERGLSQLIGNSRGKRVYYDEDCGYLISPCLCKGGQRYVHEGCLQQWRYSQVGMNSQFQCPTCSYKYKLERMTWANRIRSPVLAFLLAILLVVFTIFLLGFVADPILDLWLNRFGPVVEGIGVFDTDLEDELPLPNIDEEGWLFHFLKGTFSLGLFGAVKAIFAMSPWQWWNYRASGILGGNGRRRRAGTGRERLENINTYLILIGVATVFWVSAQAPDSWKKGLGRGGANTSKAVWKGTRKWTQRTLDMASQRVLNVQEDEDDKGDEAAGPAESQKDQ